MSTSPHGVREAGAQAAPIAKRKLARLEGPTRDELAAELRRTLRGEVRFDAGDRALYATDASNYRQLPLGVVVPRDADDVVQAMKVCSGYGAPIVSRGGGTSLAGQACNAAVVFDYSKYVCRILSIDGVARRAHVEPGVVLDTLRAQAEQLHLTFGPDPSTHNHCTLGGMIGNNSCGVHSMMAGCTASNVEALEVLTYDGERFEVGNTLERDFDAIIAAGGRRARIYGSVRAFRDRYRDAIARGFPDIPRRVSGYDLPALIEDGGTQLARALVGSEGTLVTVLSAKLRLVPSPRERVLLVLGYASVFEAADHIMEVREAEPIGLEGIDEVLVEDIKKKQLHPERTQLLPEGHGWLLVEFGGDSRAQAEEKARALMTRLGASRHAPQMKLFDDASEAQIIWKVRESGLGATARVPGERDTWEGWEDSSVPPARLGSYLRGLHTLFQRFGYRAALYGHLGQGCVHTRIPFELKRREGIAEFRSFVQEAAELVLAHGGSLSGEHGDGLARSELLPKMFGPELMRAFAEWKAIWDPTNKLNPGRIVHPYALDEHLRFGANYVQVARDTYFQFPDDERSFGYASERCVGVGECRRESAGTMCPSYMVTHEEKHSTRGRARLLFEVLRGETLQDGFRDGALREALDLCLSCKGCKGDCPLNVDMATYKAEFLAQYYKGRLRPRAAYAFGLIFHWLSLAAWFPRTTNFMLHAPGLSRLFKWLAGVEPARSIPRLATVSFRRYFRRHPRRTSQARTKVLLWVDTWSNYFQPQVALAAVEELEAAGFEVIIPKRKLCCGRPLYDYGMLRQAKQQLLGIMQALRPQLVAGVPIVGLEPSCVAVFRDELCNLFPDSPDAQLLRDNTFTLGELLQQHARDYVPPQLRRRALLHGHCHHKAVLDLDSEQKLLQAAGLDSELLDSGCCGMAGGFGYEREHYAVSVACGERKLLPAVRAAAIDTLIIADGFSCREQIAQQTDRKALHTAQVLQMAREQGPHGPVGNYPERSFGELRLRPSRVLMAGVLALIASGICVLLHGL